MSLVDSYHAYTFGTAFWYALRGAARVFDPVRVSTWFRPPSQPSIANDLEIYTIWTDGFQLLTLALILVIISGVVPLPAPLNAFYTKDPAAFKATRPIAKAIILATLFHHVTTGYGAYQHWSRASHHTKAMDIGVYGNIGLTLLGLLALTTGLSDRPTVAGKKTI